MSGNVQRSLVHRIEKRTSYSTALEGKIEDDLEEANTLTFNVSLSTMRTLNTSGRGGSRSACVPCEV